MSTPTTEQAVTTGASPSAAPRAAPVSESRRIDAIDAVRGFALLGIFLVNIAFFSQPFATVMHPIPPAGAGVADLAAHYFTIIFCQGKFYPLFSLLFGMGLILQMRSVRGAGGRFVPLYLRRLLILAAFGAAHIVFLWYGDILLIYAVVGVGLLLLRNAHPRTLITLAAVFIAVVTLVNVGFTALTLLNTGNQPAQVAAAAGPADVTPLSAPDAAEPEAQADELAPAESAADAGEPGAPTADATADATGEGSPIARLFEGFRDQTITQGPTDPRWAALETEAFREGPFLDALLFRLFNYAMVAIVSVFTFGWHALAMFLIGAALVKSDIFAPERRGTLRKLFAVGMAVGLSLAAAAGIAPSVLGYERGLVFAGVLAFPAGTLVALAYFAGVYLLATSPAGAALTRPFAAAGRMALTNYLTQTLVATFIMYHWGLGYFGSFSKAEQVGLVLAVFAAQLGLSLLWLRRFRFGPMEWVWRTLTYMRPQPLRR